MRIYEHMKRIQTDQYICRIWVTQWTHPDRIINQVKSILQKIDNLEFMTDQILDIHSDISAVEILDKNGNGFIGYQQWP